MARKEKKKKILITNIEQVPLCMEVKDVAKVLRISMPKAYEIVQMDGFPAIRFPNIGKNGKYIIPRDKFYKWLNADEYNKTVQEEETRQLKQIQQS